MTRLVMVVGTGTNVGKTFVSVRLLRTWPAGGPRAGWKPFETGGGQDSLALAAWSSPALAPARLFSEAVSPHLAARRTGSALDLPLAVETLLGHARSLADGLLVCETAGGLFSPLDDSGATNAELIAMATRRIRSAAAHPSPHLQPQQPFDPSTPVPPVEERRTEEGIRIHVLLVAPNRLGVLHDVQAVLRAVSGKGPTLDAVVLSTAPGNRDASQDSNLEELRRFSTVPVWSADDPLPQKILTSLPPSHREINKA